jgi:fluoroquinolone resistance protein
MPMDFMFEEKEDERFTGLDVSEADQLAEAYVNCEFIQCNFQGADLKKIRLSVCSFTSCNLRLCHLKGSTFNECHFKDCKLVVLDWTSVASLRSPIFETCIMDANIFSEMQLAYTKFTGSRLHDARFHGTKLKNAVFSGCDLQGAEFVQSDLRHCDFRQARHYQISPLQNQIGKAKFSFPEALALLQAFDIVIE